jgi:hypothetical protein
MTITKRQGTAAAPRGDAADDAARLARARRNAWLLGGLALAFYFGYMLLIVARGAGGA